MFRFLFQRPVGVSVSLIAMLALGILAYLAIPLQLLPQGFNFPFLFVHIPTMASSPDENEHKVAKPVEDALATLEGIKSQFTVIRTNGVGFGLSLHAHSDVALTYQHIRVRLRRQLPKLPEGAQFAFIWRHDPNDEAIHVSGISFPEGYPQAAQLIQDTLVKAIERIAGVSRVEVEGVKEKDVRIRLRSEDLKRYRIDAQQVLYTLRNDHFTMSAGVIKQVNTQSWIRVASRFNNLDQLKKRYITPQIQLQDVADVVIAASPIQSINHVNTLPAASLNVYKVSTANTIEVTAKIQACIDRIMKTDPDFKAFTATTFLDQGQFILNSLNQIKTSAFYGGLIAIVVLFLFLRNILLTLMITSAIPLCLLMTVALLYLRGESLNVLSMMGIILSIGMVIDNAIVVLEQIAQKRREGFNHLQAAIMGTRGVALAITLATLTTLIVFVPLMIVNDQPLLSFFINRVGEPVCYGLLASLLIALVHLPTGTQYLNIPMSPQNRSDRFIKIYLVILRWILKYRLVCCLLILAYLMSIAIPFTSLNRVNRAQRTGFNGLVVHLKGPLNGSQKRLNQTSFTIEKLLFSKRDTLDIKSVVARRGWSNEHVRIVLYLIDEQSQKLTADQRQDQIKALLPDYPGIKIFLRRGANNDTVEGVQISVFGPMLSTTHQFAENLAKKIKQLPQVKDAELEIPEGGLELSFAVYSQWAQAVGMNAQGIAFSLANELQERDIGDFEGAKHSMKILLTPDQKEISVDTVGHYIKNPATLTTEKQEREPSQDYMLLDDYVKRNLQPGFGKMKRKDRKIHIAINISGKPAEIMKELDPFLDRQQLPAAYGIDRGIQFSERDENEQGGAFAALVGILLVFCIMGVLFESFIIPMSILASIPLAFVGAVWMLWLNNTSFEVMAIIGGIILVGVVVNNGIVLVDQVQSLRRTGLSREDALTQAAGQRIRPILMTALTTIAGLIPMTFLGNSGAGIDYRPLGLTVMGGLLSSTILTLWVVPLFYTLLDDLSTFPLLLQTNLRRFKSLFTQSNSE